RQQILNLRRLNIEWLTGLLPFAQCMQGYLNMPDIGLTGNLQAKVRAKLLQFRTKVGKLQLIHERNTFQRGRRDYDSDWQQHHQCNECRRKSGSQMSITS